MKQYITTKASGFRNFFWLFIAFGLACMGCRKSTSDSLIEFDVTKSYPIKTLDIEEIADIEYLSLKIEDDYLFSYFVSLNEKVVICGNGVDNSFIFFNRETGKPISKIERHGNGPEEYNMLVVTVYSEKNDEFFILDYPKYFKSYARDGTFKRKIPFRKGAFPGGVGVFYDYDDNYLLFNDMFKGNENAYPTAFTLISKEDGSIKEIETPHTERISLMFAQEGGGAMMGSMPGTYFAVRNKADFLLTDYNADTVYRYTPQKEVIPVLVRRPSIQTMDVKVLLHSWVETSKYLFFSTERVEYDFNTLSGYPKKGYLMEKHSGKLFQTAIKMNEYKDKEWIIDPSVISGSSNPRTGVIVLPVSQLLRANEDKKLSGKLKETVDALTSDEEFVLMVLTFK